MNSTEKPRRNYGVTYLLKTASRSDSEIDVKQVKKHIASENKKRGKETQVYSLE